MSGGGRDHGSGTVLVLTTVILAAALAAGCAAVGQAVLARHRAAAAADLAALAAAQAGPAQPCAAAARIAGRHGGRLVQCLVEPDASVLVEVEVPVRGPLRPLPIARGRARAGRPTAAPRAGHRDGSAFGVGGAAIARARVPP